MIGSLRFAGDLSPILGLVLAVGCAAVVGWFYYRETQRLDVPYSYALPLLRSLAIALVILILTGPIWHSRQVIGTLGRVTFALDASQSMSMTDSTPSEPDRLDRAARLLIGDPYRRGWIETLSQTHQVDVVQFAGDHVATVWSSNSEQPSPKALAVSASGNRTDLSAYLSELLRDVLRVAEEDQDQVPSDQQQRHAVVMMSDGRDNVGKSSVDIASQLGAAGIVVHGLGMGSGDEPTDLGIIDVDHPDNVAADGNLAGRIVLKQIGLDDEPLRIKIESDGDTVWQQEFAHADLVTTSVPFQIDVESLLRSNPKNQIRGVRRTSIVLDLKAVVESDTDETLLENNEFPFRVGASIRNRQLLILDGSSRWETRYIRNLFQRDPAWDVTSILYGPGTDTPRVIRGSEAGQFPATDEDWSKYDAVILGEVPTEQWGPNDSSQLREFVSRGGGLIVVDGKHDRLKSLFKNTIADLLPVRYLSNEPRINVRSIRPTPAGFDQSVMNLTGDSTGLAEFWEVLPSPRMSARVVALEGAEVWANATGIDGRESPWLVTRLYGVGRVFFLSSDETWRWRYKVADRFHARFWNQLLFAAIQPPYSAQDEFASIATDQIEYSANASPRVRARLQNQDGDPVGDSTVDALFVKDDRVVATVPLMVEDPLRGTYEGLAAPLPTGQYSIRIRASAFDQASFLASIPICICQGDRAQLNQLSLAAQTMSHIATDSGGEYFHESQADDLLSRLAPLSSGQVVESDLLIWQSFYWFWLVILVLGIEWWLRKKTGLA